MSFCVCLSNVISTTCALPFCTEMAAKLCKSFLAHIQACRLTRRLTVVMSSSLLYLRPKHGRLLHNCGYRLMKLVAYHRRNFVLELSQCGCILPTHRYAELSNELARSIGVTNLLTHWLSGGGGGLNETFTRSNPKQKSLFGMRLPRKCSRWCHKSAG